MGNFGPSEMLFIAVFALLVFGPQKLPEIARSVGKAVRELKRATSEFTSELKLDEPDPKKTETKEPPKERKPGPR